MKKKILGLVCSPRKLGNCELMIKEIAKHISTPHELRLIRLNSFQIKPCLGCYKCLFGEMRCPQKDDYYLVLEEILAADALILTVPTYFLGPNAVLKNFLDRGLSMYAFTKELAHKPALGIGIAGIPGKEGYTLLGIENFLKILMSDIKAVEMVYGALPGEVFLNKENLQRAKDLGEKLFAPAKPDKGPQCPLCAGKTFRILKGNRVRCMLCSNEGTMKEENGVLKISIHSSGHDLFLSDEQALGHMLWLQEMKEKYLTLKDDLQEVVKPYKSQGTWVKKQKQKNPQ